MGLCGNLAITLHLSFLLQFVIICWVMELTLQGFRPKTKIKVFLYKTYCYCMLPLFIILVPFLLYEWPFSLKNNSIFNLYCRKLTCMKYLQPRVVLDLPKTNLLLFFNKVTNSLTNKQSRLPLALPLNTLCGCSAHSMLLMCLHLYSFMINGMKAVMLCFDLLWGCSLLG